MPVPALGPFGLYLYDRIKPMQFAEAENDYALAKLVGGIASMAEDIDFLVRDTITGDPGWSVILDIDRAPVAWLPWLGQTVGVEVDPTLSEADQRQQIRDEEGFRRGTVQDLITRIKRHLTGRKIVILRERDFSPYHFSVVLYSSDAYVETYAYEELYDQEATYVDVFYDFSEYGIPYERSVGAESKIIQEVEKRPAPLQYRLAILDGQDYWELWQDYLEYQGVYDAYLTYQELLDDAPVPHPFPFESLLWYQTYRRLWHRFQDYQVVWNRETTY